MSKFVEKSYRQNQGHYAEHVCTGDLAEHASCWLNADTVDSWRHQRMYSCLDPIIERDMPASWLTIGDGRYGADSRYIRSKGGTASPSDIDDSLLKEANEKGLLDGFYRENAERLSFSSDSFDYVLCKESYHHFPRPMLALYEMLRVAKNGVVFKSEKIKVMLLRAC